MIPLAVFGSVAVGVILLIFTNKKSYSNPYIVVLHCEGNDSEGAAVEYLKSQVKHCVIRSKTVRKEMIELQIDIRIKGDNTGFVNHLSAMQGVGSAVLVSYNGDYMG